MNSFILLAQTEQHQGWLTLKLLNTLTSDAEWVLWLLAVLSVMSVAVMLERAIFFMTSGLKDRDTVIDQLAQGKLEDVSKTLGNQNGMEASVLKAGISWAAKGPDAVQEIINSTLAKERPRYERFMSFLGTLGSNTPFIGLFGTVLGIIKAFKDLGNSTAKGAAVQATVMAGISEALVATAVGLAVAIPAVIGYNLLQRNLKTMTSRANSLGHMLVGQLRGNTKGS
jgi:biopolymer transport protein ExbB